MQANQTRIARMAGSYKGSNRARQPVSVRGDGRFPRASVWAFHDGESLKLTVGPGWLIYSGSEWTLELVGDTGLEPVTSAM
jgi:hypothetical protein